MQPKTRGLLGLDEHMPFALTCPTPSALFLTTDSKAVAALPPFQLQDGLHDFRRVSAGHPAEKTWTWDWLAALSARPFPPGIVLLKVTRKGACETVVPLLEIPDKQRKEGAKTPSGGKMTSCWGPSGREGERVSPP